MFLAGALTATTALAGGLYAPPLWAQDIAPLVRLAQIETEHSFDIPTQPLTTALTLFGQQAGLQVTVHAALVRDRTAPEVRGRMTSGEALSRLLAGTGLVYAIAGDGTVVIEEPGPPSIDGAIELGPVRVVGDRSNTLTEGTGSYKTGAVSTATRLNLSPRETPQTISVVTRQQIEDFSLVDIDDILGSTSGVFVYDRGPNGSEYFSRGFEVQSQYDGIPNPLGISQSNIAPPPDSALLDHVEIIQGASGLLTGAGQPGGVVNLVRKMPTRHFQASLAGRIGSWDFIRAEADVSGPLNKSGSVRGRAVVAYQDNETFVDFERNNKEIAYGVLEADITDSTNVMASIQYLDWVYNKHAGVPRGPDGADLGFSRSSFFGIVGDDNQQKENLLFTTRLIQQLGAEWQAQVAFQRSENDVATKSNFLIGVVDTVTGDGLTSLTTNLGRDFKTNSLDAHVKGPLTLFGQRHEVFLGFNGLELKERFRNAISRPTVNIYNYDPFSIAPPSDLGEWGEEEIVRQYGFYGGSRFSLADSLKVIFGSRISWYEDPFTEEDGVYSPYAGVIYDINRQFSVYGSYSDIFTAQEEKSGDGSRLSPIVGGNYEAGIKGEFFDGTLNGSLALFRLAQTNLAEVDETIPFDPDNVCGGTCYVSAGKVVSKGIDLNISGEFPFGLQLNAFYTYQNSEVTEGEDVGQAFNTLQPNHVFRISGLYNFPGGKWSVGADVTYRSEIYQEGIYRGFAYRTEQDAVFLAGFRTLYQANEHLNVNLAIENLTDKKYFESVGSTRLYNLYGAPRSVFLSVKYGF